MPLLVNWPTKFITVPKSELTLIEGTRYKITVEYLWQLLREANANEEGIVFETMYNSIPPTSSTPRIVEVVNGYTMSFEDGLYSVEIVNGNTNFREVEVKNQVSVGTNNTTGFIDPTFLESSLFVEGVIVDVINGVPGTGKTPDGGIIGTRKTPSSNISDALEISHFRGTPDIVVITSMEIAGVDLSVGHRLVGDSPYTLLTLSPTANLLGAAMENLTLQGDVGGDNSITNCFLMNVTSVSGVYHGCAFGGDVVLNGSLDMFDCNSRVEGGGYPTFDVGPHRLVARGFKGSFGVHGAADGHVSSIGVSGGRFIAEATCTGGEIHLRGQPFEVVDHAQVPGMLIDEMEGAKVRDIRAAHYNKRVWDKDANTVTVYAEDGATPLYMFDVNDDLSSVTPQ